MTARCEFIERRKRNGIISNQAREQRDFVGFVTSQKVKRKIDSYNYTTKCNYKVLAKAMMCDV